MNFFKFCVSCERPSNKDKRESVGKKTYVVKKFRVTKIIIEIKRYEVKSSLPKLDSFRAPFLKEIVAFIIHDNKRGEIDDVDLPNRFHPQLRELLDLHFLDVGFG